MSSLTDEALETQLGLIRWHESTIAPRYYETMMYLQERDMRVRSWTGSTLCVALHTILNTAETFAVTDDMCEVLEAAMTTLPVYPLAVVDVPCSRGFVFFERPLLIPDRKLRNLALKGFTWTLSVMDEASEEKHLNSFTRGETQREHGGLWISLFTDPRNEGDMNHDDFAPLSYSETGPLVYASDFPWAWGESWHDLGEYIVQSEHDDTPNVPEDVLLDQSTKVLRLIATFFRIVMEPWVDSSAILPGRPARRRRARLTSLNIPEETVKVVALRRSKEGYVPPEGDDKAESKFSHRWLVRPHWRNQWYPSEQRHAPRYIEGYVKGPAGTPIVVHDHVFEWRR